jgi:hypothetical protein
MMATQPKPKPKPEPPEPKPGEDAAAANLSRESQRILNEDDPPQTNASDNSLTDRIDALFASQVALIERVEKLEERVAAPPVGIGRRP